METKTNQQFYAALLTCYEPCVPTAVAVNSPSSKMDRYLVVDDRHIYPTHQAAYNAAIALWGWDFFEF